MDTNIRSSGNNIVDWQSSETTVLLNTHWPESDLEFLKELAFRYPQKSHIWIASSGSSAKDLRSVKLIALSKQAFLVAAQAANRHLQSTSSDIWINVLPTFHVGGLSIFARAHLSRAVVKSFLNIWDPQKFHQYVVENSGTLTSLVPAQVFDLVKNKLRSPASLRAIVVGGGALDMDLYFQARDLGWPLLPSFGMTEVCSQLATADLGSLNKKEPKLKILSHIQATTDPQGKLKVKSEALLTGYAFWQGNQASWVDPKENGWFLTEDQVEIQGNELMPMGRGQQYIKILGEGVSLFRLQNIFEKIVRQNDPDLWQSYALLAIPDPRKGHSISVAHSTDGKDLLAKIVCQYNSEVLSLEKIDHVFQVGQIPRSDLGKVRSELLLQDLKKFF